MSKFYLKAILLLLISSVLQVGHANAAVVNLTGMHQQFVSRNCPKDSPCTIEFARIPAGKQMVVRRVHCATDGEIANFKFQTTASGGVVTGRTPLVSSAAEVMHLVDATHTMRVLADNFDTIAVSVSCMIVGEILN